jgi:hypothetical protein
MELKDANISLVCGQVKNNPYSETDQFNST